MPERRKPKKPKEDRRFPLEAMFAPAALGRKALYKLTPQQLKEGERPIEGYAEKFRPAGKAPPGVKAEFARLAQPKTSHFFNLLRALNTQARSFAPGTKAYRGSFQANPQHRGGLQQLQRGLQLFDEGDYPRGGQELTGQMGDRGLFQFEQAMNADPTAAQGGLARHELSHAAQATYNPHEKAYLDRIRGRKPDYTAPQLTLGSLKNPAAIPDETVEYLQDALDHARGESSAQWSELPRPKRSAAARKGQRPIKFRTLLEGGGEGASIPDKFVTALIDAISNPMQMRPNTGGTTTPLINLQNFGKTPGQGQQLARDLFKVIQRLL